ncbi:MAG: hypothetical protein JXX28_09970 [Deltaproteobacteria bacterium]|nr:hypothetical protein [Deltaproteobacteria bacterium]
MTLEELTQEELLTLIGLAKVLIRADKSTTAEEHAAIDALAGRLGPERWESLLREAAGRFRTQGDVMDLAAQVDREPAQRFLYRQLYALAGVDDLVPAEAAILGQLAAMWKISED